MKDIDDPLLALIVRFVVAEADSELPQEACMRLQVTLIRQHIAAFPPEDREAHAFKWVERHAHRFREDCKGKLVAAALADEGRCRDCPLLDTEGGRPCVIHERWCELVDEYFDRKLSSAEYVSNSLALLQDHKDQLKVTMLREEPLPQAST